MKTRYTILALIAAMTVGAQAANTNDQINAYISGYVLVTNGFADAGDTGLTPGTAYAAIPIASISYLSETVAQASGTNSSYRTFLFSLFKTAHETLAAMPTTNSFDRLRSAENARAVPSYLRFSHTFESDVSITDLTIGVED